MKFIYLSATTLILSMMSIHASAEELKLYAGGGATFNRIDSPFVKNNAKTAAGLSAFLGRRFNRLDGELEPRVQISYGKTEEFIKNTQGDYSIDSLAISAMVRKYVPEIDPKLYAQAKLGLDFGDDDGLFQGLATGYQITSELSAQYEYQNKDASSSHQLSLIFDF